VHSEAKKAPDMASTPGRATSSTAPAGAWTPLPTASSTGPVVLVVAKAASRASLDTIFQVQFPVLLGTCWNTLELLQSALLEWLLQAPSD
jgi:hypothetical protein